MPCSRSARRPSVTWARSSWASSNDFESSSSRPISVDLPSSTEPAVAIRRRSLISGRLLGPGGSLAAVTVVAAGARRALAYWWYVCARRVPAAAGGTRENPSGSGRRPLEIPLALAVFHGRGRRPVVRAGRAALGLG